MSHIFFTIILVVLQFLLPRRFAYVPLIVAAMHTSQLAVLPSLTTARTVTLAGILRAFLAGQINRSKSKLDSPILLLVAVLFFTSFLHESSVTYPNPTFSRLRVIVDVLCTYIYGRAFIPKIENYVDLIRVLAFSAIPLGLIMYLSSKSGKNPYSVFGVGSELVVRNGEARASGPFGHAILAGTLGALMMPLFVIIWSHYRKTALIGFACCVLIIFSSASSTPIGSALLLIGFIYFWRFRQHTKTALILIVIMLFIMHLIKERPIWYLIALTDFTGSSTGYHRAMLIDQAIKYFGEWWLYGSEYTKHWFPYGLVAIPEHCDHTNYYIYFGVMGGFGAVIILVSIFIISFQILTKAYNLTFQKSVDMQFCIWCLRSLLAGHMIICLTISYFDQIFIHFFLLIGLIANLDLLAQEQKL